MNKTEYEPFGSFSTPFKIGLKLLYDTDLFQRDSNFETYLAEKKNLFADQFNDVFMAEPDTINAQNEVLDFVVSSISGNFASDLKTGTTPCPITALGRNRAEYANTPLALASLLVQDDLVIMRRKPDGWHLVAASLCFPSSWNLAEKFGRPLTEIHQPVPGVNQQLDPMIHRIFDNLKPELPVWRENWSIYGDDKLRHDSAETNGKFSDEHSKPANSAFVRREFQTLHKLSLSDDILFTIKIMVEPINVIGEQENAKEIAQQLLVQIECMSGAQKAYKGFDQGMDYARTYLRSVAGSTKHD